MSLFFRGVFSRFDWWMISSAFCLSSYGLVIIYSLTWSQDSRFVKQILFLILGFSLFFFLQFLDLNFWRNSSFFIYAAVVFFLFALIVFGQTTRGVRGWFFLGSIGIQPAEFAKFGTVLFLASTLERLRFDLTKFRHLFLAGAVLGVPFFLTLFQPDFGSAFIILVCGLSMIFYTGLDKKKIAIFTLAVLILSVIGWFGILHDYQKERITTFLNPESDPLNSGYNVIQSVVAIGSGGLLGKGVGLGTQSQLNFLPEQETDFVFASLAEELGFLGAGFLILVYSFLLWRIYSVLRDGSRPFCNFLVLGLFVMFFFQGAINIGMNMGVFPVTGITLPFVSYGGSSLLASFLSIGVISSFRS